jgi:hypothetical protein
MADLNQKVVRFLTLKLFWCEAVSMETRYPITTQFRSLSGFRNHFSDSYYRYKYYTHYYFLKTKGKK